jgi:hypothetical protein
VDFKNHAKENRKIPDSNKSTKENNNAAGPNTSNKKQEKVGSLLAIHVLNHVGGKKSLKETWPH